MRNKWICNVNFVRRLILRIKMNFSETGMLGYGLDAAGSG
jgi:hypothetical protein